MTIGPEPMIRIFRMSPRFGTPPPRRRKKREPGGSLVRSVRFRAPSGAGFSHLPGGTGSLRFALRGGLWLGRALAPSALLGGRSRLLAGLGRGFPGRLLLGR